jgi:putative aminopeptidase
VQTILLNPVIVSKQTLQVLVSVVHYSARSNPENSKRTINCLLRILTLAILFTVASNTAAQNGPTAEYALKSWMALDAPPGREYLATDELLIHAPRFTRDALGNLLMRRGSGSPRRVIACSLDRPGFAVTEITEDGYLRLREVGAGRQHQLWVQFHEGQRIRVLTRTGSVPGVVIVKSTHLQGGRAANAPVATLNDLWVDIGAASKVEVQRRGIEMLDPLVRDVEAFRYGDFISGPFVGLRAGCAVIGGLLAYPEVRSGETIYLMTTLRSFGNDGLEASLRPLGRVDEVTILDQPIEGDNSSDSVIRRKVEKPPYLPESTGLTSVTVLAPRVRFPGTFVESVELNDLEKFYDTVAKTAGVETFAAGPRWSRLSAKDKRTPAPQDALSGTASLLQTLADVPAVSGHEAKVREAIKTALPAWARSLARTDQEGNLIVEVGPDRDPLMFIAHQDEVGFEVASIATDGTVSLRTRGGLFPSLWEGQPALLHFDTDQNKAPLTGVFVPRASANTKQPEELTAWFGVDAGKLKELGVVVGQSVTAVKRATRLGATRFTARALDDRAGSTALILAARRIVPATLKRKVILAWAVREEVGLEGAMAMAKHYGSLVKRVYSVDTLVSSDSPVETTRFAHAPLGQGAVIRGLDNASVAPPAELDRVVNIARTHSIPLQVNATNGGTDGSDFVRYGVLHLGLSWPGRYSHSPVEVLDLRDLQALERLVYAIATAP